MPKEIYGSVLNVVLASVCSFAAIHHVPDDYTTVQQAIDSCINGDTVVLAAGTYVGDGNRDIDFKGKAITVRGTDPNDPAIIASTIIDCQNQGRGFTFESGEQADSILEGITIINGKAEGGGGILVSNSSPTISKCTVRHCSEEYPTCRSGGGIGISTGDPLITDCQISNNATFYEGAGIFCDEGSPTIINSIIENNRSAYGNGAGIYYSGSGKPSIINCTVRGNSTRSNGGGIYIFGGQPTVSQCSIIENTSEGKAGGGIYIQESNALISHCTIADNYAVAGGGLKVGGQGPSDRYTLRVEHCRITGNSANSQAGGLSSILCTLYMSNCVISGNCKLYGGAGGAVSIGAMVIAEINQCTIVGNRVAPNPDPNGRCVGGALVLNMCDVKIANSIIRENRSTQGSQIFITRHPLAPLDRPTLVTLHHNDFAGEQDKDVYIYGEPNLLTLEMYSNLDVDPCFANPGWWDPNGTLDDPNDDFWVEGDYHLQSQAGHWDPNNQTWIQDEVTSPCIDAGDLNTPIAFEPFPNGGIINLGAYGGTAEASKSYFGRPVCDKIIAGDINGDCKVDFKDFAIMALHWLENNSL